MHGHKVTCPLHNWVINLENGNAVAPDEGCVQRYQTRMESTTIYLEIKTRTDTLTEKATEVA